MNAEEFVHLLNEIVQEYFELTNTLISYDDFYDAVKRKIRNKNIPESYIKNGTKLHQWYDLKFKQYTEQLQYIKPPKEYLPIYSKDPGSFQVDLMFLTKYSKDIPNYYTTTTITIFCAIEINSRWAFALVLKDKTAKECLRGFYGLILKYGNQVNVINSDQGSEFNNKLIQDFLKDQNTEYRFSDVGDKYKMGKIERFNRTLKERILDQLQARFKVYNKPAKIDEVALIVNQQVREYNMTYHSAIGLSPNEFRQDIRNNINEYMKQKKKTHEILSKRTVLPVGTFVQIGKNRRTDTFGSKLNQIKFENGNYKIVSSHDPMYNKFKNYNLLDVDTNKILKDKVTNRPVNVKNYMVKKIPDPNYDIFNDDDIDGYETAEEDEYGNYNPKKKQKKVIEEGKHMNDEDDEDDDEEEEIIEKRQYNLRKKQPHNYSNDQAKEKELQVKLMNERITKSKRKDNKSSKVPFKRVKGWYYPSDDEDHNSENNNNDDYDSDRSYDYGADPRWKN